MLGKNFRFTAIASPDRQVIAATASPEEDHRKSQRTLTLKNLYRSFVNNTFEFIFRSTPSGRLLFSNRFFVRSLGFESYRAAKASPIARIFESAEVYEQIAQRIFIEKRICNETVHFRTLSGQRLVGLINCQLHNDEKGQPVLNWTVLDISQRIEYEESLKQKNEQLAKVNTQMEKFLYSTSHDLRSPLTSILGLVNLLKMELQDNGILEYIDKIEQSTHKMDKIIRDLMSFSKNTYQRVKSEPIDFQQLVWRVVNNYRLDPNFPKIHFDVCVENGAPYFSDQERIEIIVDSVIRNAIHFMDVTKLRPFVKIEVKVNAEQVALQIIDNGIGIGKQHHEQIFNMFYKASTYSRGAGLGLYIVKEGVEQLRGKVQVESELGFGSVFRLSIPNVQPDKATIPA